MKTRRAECKTGKRQGQQWNLAGERLESRGGRQVSARSAGATGRYAPGEQGRQTGERQGQQWNQAGDRQESRGGRQVSVRGCQRL